MQIESKLRANCGSHYNTRKYLLCEDWVSFTKEQNGFCLDWRIFLDPGIILTWLEPWHSGVIANIIV